MKKVTKSFNIREDIIPTIRVAKNRGLSFVRWSMLASRELTQKTGMSVSPAKCVELYIQLCEYVHAIAKLDEDLFVKRWNEIRFDDESDIVKLTEKKPVMLFGLEAMPTPKMRILDLSRL